MEINKLSESVFLENIAYMMAWYNNFNLRLRDSDGSVSLQYKIWYGAFENMNDGDFEMIVNGYCKSNTYPPSSPTSLLDYAHTRLMEMKSNEINKAWEELMVLITVNGYGYYKTIKGNGYVNVYPLKQALEAHENPLLKKVYDVMSSKIQAMTDFSRMEVLKEFSKIYGELLSQGISNKISQGELGLDNKKLLKEKE